MCDRCYGMQGKPGPITTQHLELDDTQWEIDLCQLCEAELLSGLRIILSHYGTPAQKRKQVRPKGCAQAPVACPLCLQDRSNNRGIAIHLANEHGVKLSSRTHDDLYGAQCPLCGEETSLFDKVHAKRVHGLTRIYDVWAQARLAGDPHGVMAENEKRLLGLAQMEDSFQRGSSRHEVLH